MIDIQLEGNKMVDEMKAYRHIKKRMDFQEDFDMSLDALWDQLINIDKATCVTLNDSDVFKENLGAFSYDVIDIFSKASQVNDDLVFECF